MRQALTKPLWDELHLWLRLERTRVPDGGTTAQAIVAMSTFLFVDINVSTRFSCVNTEHVLFPRSPAS